MPHIISVVSQELDPQRLLVNRCLLQFPFFQFRYSVTLCLLSLFTDKFEDLPLSFETKTQSHYKCFIKNVIKIFWSFYYSPLEKVGRRLPCFSFAKSINQVFLTTSKFLLFFWKHWNWGNATKVCARKPLARKYSVFAIKNFTAVVSPVLIFGWFFCVKLLYVKVIFVVIFDCWKMGLPQKGKLYKSL